MEIKILTFAKKHGRAIGTIGSSIIRGKWLVENWPEASLWKEGEKSDVLIFQKVYWEEMLLCYPGIKILDLCDPDWLNGGLELRKISGLVDAITCSSPGIFEYVSKISKAPVYLVPDRINFKFFDVKKEHIGKARRVVWFGYYHNLKAALPQVLLSLKRINMDLLIISNEDFKPLNDYGVDIENRKFSWETMKYDITFGDILINPQPMEISPRFKYKSNNKTLIAWALGMPVAETLDDLKRFLDPEERKKEAEAKLIEVKRDWDINLSIKEFNKIIANVKAKKENNN